MCCWFNVGISRSLCVFSSRGSGWCLAKWDVDMLVVQLEYRIAPVFFVLEWQFYISESEVTIPLFTLVAGCGEAKSGGSASEWIGGSVPTVNIGGSDLQCLR